MSSHFWEIKNLHGKQVIATLDNRNSLPFETEEEQEEAREFFKKLEERENDERNN